MLNELIAKILFHLGTEPKATTFVDGERTSWGFGKLDGWTGTWEYQLPFGYKEKKEIVVTCKEIDTHELRYVLNNPHGVETIQWIRKFPNKVLYLRDRIKNASDYNEQKMVSTPTSPVIILINVKRNGQEI